MYNHVYHITHSTTTKKLVDRYNQQLQDFMASKTVKQFKALLPTSPTPSKLLADVQLVVSSDQSACTLDDLKSLVRYYGVVGNLKCSKPDQLGNLSIQTKSAMHTVKCTPYHGHIIQQPSIHK